MAYAVNNLIRDIDNDSTFVDNYLLDPKKSIFTLSVPPLGSVTVEKTGSAMFAKIGRIAKWDLLQFAGRRLAFALIFGKCRTLPCGHYTHACLIQKLELADAQWWAATDQSEFVDISTIIASLPHIVGNGRVKPSHVWD